jgi:hypothetical protein
MPRSFSCCCRLVPQRARAADDADVARQVDVARHDAQKRLAGADGAGAVRPGQHHAAFAGVAHHVALDPDHVLRRDAVGDADAIADAAIGRFHDAVGGKGRRHEDQAGVAAGGGGSLFHGVEDRHAHDGFAALAGHHAGHHVGAVVQHFLGVELRHAAGDALHDDAAAAVQENAHHTALILVFCLRSFFQAVTARSAASIRVLARMIGRPDFARIFCPSSTLVPDRRTITGTSTGFAVRA